MSLLARWLYAFGAFLVGWAAEGLLDEGVESIASKDGKCVKKYTVRSVENECISCMACKSAIDQLEEIAGFSGTGVASMSNEQMSEILDEVSRNCPIDLVSVEIECTPGV